MKSNISFEDTSVAFSYKSDNELRRSYLLFALMNNRLLVKIGTNMVKIALKLKMPVRGIIKKTVFTLFCGGESIADCEKTIDKLHAFNIGTILDYAVEGEDAEVEFDGTRDEILRTIERSKSSASIPFCVFKPTGVASIGLLSKIQSGDPLDDDESASYNRVKGRFETLAEAAYQNNVRLLVDSEESWIQEPIDMLVYDQMAKYNSQTAIIFNTYQLYRKGMLDRIKRAVEAASGRYIVGAKLVRGAYMEKERRRAGEMGYPDPILPSKEKTDRQYNEALEYCLRYVDHIHICSGSHNERSNLLLSGMIEQKGLQRNDSRIFFAQLYGMSDNISFNLARTGYNVAKYVPYGPVKSVMPYLFRRAEENTAIRGQTSREFELVKRELLRRKQRHD